MVEFTWNIVEVFGVFTLVCVLLVMMFLLRSFRDSDKDFEG